MTNYYICLVIRLTLNLIFFTLLKHKNNQVLFQQKMCCRNSIKPTWSYIIPSYNNRIRHETLNLSQNKIVKRIKTNFLGTYHHNRSWARAILYSVGQPYPPPSQYTPYRAPMLRTTTYDVLFIRKRAYLRDIQSSSSAAADWSASAAGSSFFDHSNRHDVTRKASAHGRPRRMVRRQPTTTMTTTTTDAAAAAAAAVMTVTTTVTVTLTVTRPGASHASRGTTTTDDDDGWGGQRASRAIGRTADDRRRRGTDMTGLMMFGECRPRTDGESENAGMERRKKPEKKRYTSRRR